MRIPYPERFEWKYIAVFSTVLFVFQLAAGTDLRWAVLVGLYMVLFTFAFNASGGLPFPSGAYIFFTGTLVVMVGVVWKTLLFLPNEKYLHLPLLTMVCECCVMFSLWMAVLASKRFTPKHGILARHTDIASMKQAAIGCMVIGILFIFASGGRTEGGSIGSALAQINRFPQFAIMLATTYEIHVSKGKRAFNWVVWVTAAYIFIIGGIIYTSKEGMFQAPVTWLIAAAASGYRIKPRQLIVGGFFLFVVLYYLVPYSQYVRNFRDKDGNRAANQKVALEYIFKLKEVRELATVDDSTYLQAPHFYPKEQGLIDRLSMLSFDDAIIERTEDGYVFGLYPVWASVLNVVPHFIWKNKPQFSIANVYGHEISVIPDDDVTTGISFGVAGDAYHEAKWFGLLAVCPLLAFIFFLANDTFTGSSKESPWALLVIITVSHGAPEGMLPGLVAETVMGSLIIGLMALIIRYPVPLAFRVLTGGERTVVRKSQVLGLGTRRLAPTAASTEQVPPA